MRVAGVGPERRAGLHGGGKVLTSALLARSVIIISFISTFSFNIARLTLMLNMEII